MAVQKKSAAQEYYDVTDPFIDDSELAVDERTFFAQTKQQGFYVSSGQVALLTDKYVLSVYCGAIIPCFCLDRPRPSRSLVLRALCLTFHLRLSTMSLIHPSGIYCLKSILIAIFMRIQSLL